jgi:hypothetical protein
VSRSTNGGSFVVSCPGIERTKPTANVAISHAQTLASRASSPVRIAVRKITGEAVALIERDSDGVIWTRRTT